MTRKRTFPLALAVALLLVPAAAMAQPADRPMHPGPGPGPGRGPNLERMVELLDLTPQQRHQIDAIFTKHHDGAMALESQIATARDTLRDAIHADLFDEGSIRDAAATVSLLEADRAVEQARVLQDVRQVLTPAQKEKLDQLQERRRDRMQNRMHDGMRPRRADPGPRR